MAKCYLSQNTAAVMLDNRFSERLKFDNCEKRVALQYLFSSFNLNHAAEQDSAAVGRSVCLMYPRI